MSRKKFEFKPDRDGINLANKLYLTAQQRKKILKWGLYAVSCVIAMILQDSMLAKVRLLGMGAMLDLTPCLMVLICIIEGAERGGMFVLWCSVFYVLSGTAPGPYCVLFLTVYSMLAALLRENFLRRSFSSNWLCAWIALLAYEMSVFLMGVFQGHTYPGRYDVFLATAVVGGAIVPLLYPQMGWIGKIGGETWKE